MGDGEHLTLIFSVTFLSIFILLVGFMPAELVENQLGYEKKYYSSVEVPESWDTSMIGEGEIIEQDFDNITLHSFNSFTLDTATLNVWWSLTSSHLNLDIMHVHSWWVLTWEQKMVPYSFTKEYLQSLQVDNVSSLTIRCETGDFQCLVQFGFSGLGADNFSEAWDNGEIGIWFGLRSQDTEALAHYDAWTLLGNILAFQNPDLGVSDPTWNTVLNALIAIPLWTAFGICVLYILSKIKPF